MEEPKGTIESLDPILLEYPFVRPGMTIEEYDEEREYYSRHSASDLKSRKYKPLWKQREEKESHE